MNIYACQAEQIRKEAEATKLEAARAAAEKKQKKLAKEAKLAEAEANEEEEKSSVGGCVAEEFK